MHFPGSLCSAGQPVQKILKCFLPALFFLMPGFHRALGQNRDQNRSLVIEEYAEKIFESTGDETDLNTLFADLNRFLEDPLNLNAATRDELEKLQVLTDFQVSSLHTYIETNGPLETIYELPLVYGFTEEIARLISPFVTVQSVPSSVRDLKFSGWRRHGRHSLILRSKRVLEQQEGYTSPGDTAGIPDPNSRYPGNPWRYYARYKYAMGSRIRAGFIAEKDPGEEFFAGTSKTGFDFYSGHIAVTGPGTIKNAILGDYQLRLGQGLNFWSGLSFGKSPYAVSIRKKATGIIPYASTNENRFLRGIATTLAFNRFELSTFFSHKKVDGNIVKYDSANNKPVVFSAFQETGMHRIPREIEDEKSVPETIGGGHFRYNSEKLEIGFTAVHYFFGAELKRDDTPWNQYRFSGTSNTNFGIDYHLMTGRVSMFGEAAMSINRGKALLNGINFDPFPMIRLALLHRWYQKNHQALYADAFGEDQNAVNENGFYLGTSLEPFKNWMISGYFDVFSFPWVRYNTSGPSHGHDHFFECKYLAGDDLTMYIRYRMRMREEDAQTAQPGIAPTGKNRLSGFRYDISYKISEKFRFRNRVEITASTDTDHGKSSGYLLYHDATGNFGNFPLRMAFRIAVFDVENYAARIYAYEHDVLYAFSVPAYYGRGIRTYLNLRYPLSEKIDLWMKYAMTAYNDRDRVGSGLSATEGNKRSDLTLQCRFRF